MADIKNIPLAERLKTLNQVASAINTKAKKTVCGFASDPAISEKLKIRFYPFPSINLNFITGGGVPAGKISIVSGESDSGKTTLLLQTIAFNMKRDPNFIAVWLESENSVDVDAVCNQYGIDKQRFLYIELERNGAAEGAIDQLEAQLATGYVSMAVMNSLKCMVPSDEFEKEMGQQTIGLQARMNGKMVRKLTALIAEHGTALVLVNHLTTQIGVMHGDPLIQSGGRAIRYASMLTLDIRKKSIQDSDPVPREDHLKIGVSVKKNHCLVGRNPYMKCDYFVKYDVGILVDLEVLENAVELGYISKGGGGWLTDMDPETGEPRIDDNGNKMKWQGLAKFRAYCLENEKYFADLRAKVESAATGHIEAMTGDEVDKAKAETDGDGEFIDSLTEPDDPIADAKAKKKKK